MGKAKKHRQVASSLKIRGKKVFKETASIFQVILSSVIFAVSLISANHIPDFMFVGMLALSSVISCLSLLHACTKKIKELDFFSESVISVLVVVLSYIIGFYIEAAALSILIQIRNVFLNYASEKTVKSALHHIHPTDADNAEYLKNAVSESMGINTQIEDSLINSINFVFKFAVFFAISYAIILPLISDFSVKVSIHRALIILIIATTSSIGKSVKSLSLVGLCDCADYGVFLKNSQAMESLGKICLVALENNDTFEEITPRIVSISTPVEKNTFLNLIYNVVYYSKQKFATAIVNQYKGQLVSGAISDFEEIPDCGVRVKINGKNVRFVNDKYLKSTDSDKPDNENNKGTAYYLYVEGKYFGKIILSVLLDSFVYDLAEELLEDNSITTVMIANEHSEMTGFIVNDPVIKQVYTYDSEQAKEDIIFNLNADNYNKCAYIHSEPAEKHSAACIDLSIINASDEADGFITEGNISELNSVINICSRVTEKITTNVIISFVVKAAMIFLSIIGYCNLWLAALADILVGCVIILSSATVSSEPILKTLLKTKG